jgi:hypothetical protein
MRVASDKLESEPHPDRGHLRLQVVLVERGEALAVDLTVISSRSSNRASRRSPRSYDAFKGDTRTDTSAGKNPGEEA